MKKFLPLLLLLAACSPKTEEDFACEGRAKCRQITSLLEKIETPEDFIIYSGPLKKRFAEMAQLVERGETYCRETGYQKRGEMNPDSEALLFHLKRIYQLPAGRKFIEGCQGRPD